MLYFQELIQYGKLFILKKQKIAKILFTKYWKTFSTKINPVNGIY